MHYRYLQFPGGKNKAITFSYDDGCPQDVRFANKLAECGMKGTFNLTMGHKMSVEEVKEHILGNGHEIAVHGAKHMAPGITPVTRGIQDVLNGRLYLEQTVGRIVRGMAYPDCGITRSHNGVTYAEIKQYLTALGITYGRSLNGDNDKFELPQDWHNWIPTTHHDNPDLFKYADKVFDESAFPKYRFPRLFYVWGHTYEFDRKDNWDHLDAICEKLSGRDDVWYATNGEIYEYVKAYHSLVYSADESMIYNPTLHTVWFCTREEEYVIKPGETLRL